MEQSPNHKFHEIRKALRQRCRVDLYALCDVLGFKDVCPEVHAPIIDELQKFEGGKDVEVSPGVFEYTPSKPLWKLAAERPGGDLLILYPRGHLKTTICSIAHTIQCIINYPEVRVCLSTCTGEQTKIVLGSILTQFRFNVEFRLLFPELCPPAEKAADFGNQTSMTVMNRGDYTRKEPTIWTSTLGKVNAGFRADFIKHADLVTEHNVKTPTGIKDVISHYGHFEPIVERFNARDICEVCEREQRHREDAVFESLGPVSICCDKPMVRFKASRGWNDVEGTRYDYGDLYGVLIKDSSFRKIVRSAIKEDGTPLWPSRYPIEELEKIRKKPTVGDWIFSAQYLNKCIPQGDGLCDPSELIWIPYRILQDIKPRLRMHCTIDGAGSDPESRGDPWVLDVAGFDTDGRFYVYELDRGRFSPEQVVDNIFDIHRRYPGIIDFKIEADKYTAMLMPHFVRECSKRQRYPQIVMMERDTTVTKQNRIKGLRPWLKNGNVRFNADIPPETKLALMEEVQQFPSQSSGVFDDCLDTLTDMLQNADGEVNLDVIADPPDMKTALFGVPTPADRFLGFGENGIAEWLHGNNEDDRKGPRSMTGVLQ